MPITGSNVPTIIRRHTAAVDNDAEDDEANTSNDFDHGKYEFHFAITSDAKYLDQAEEDHKDGDPNADVNVFSPILNGDRGGGEFEGQDCQPADGIVPAHSKPPGWVNEAHNVGIEGAIDRIEDRQFTEGLHGAQQHEADDDEADENAARTASSQGAT